MNLDLLPNEQWELLNDQVKQLLGIPADCTSKVFLGGRHAVLEGCLQVAQIFSHKKSIGIVRGATPYFEPVASWFMREGYHVQQVEVSKFENEASVSTWVDSLDKDTNFVLWPEDHAVTSELVNVHQLDSVLNSKKIFSLRVSHANHLSRKCSVLGYSSQICSFGPDLAVLIAGSRLRLGGIIAPQLHWKEKEILGQIKNTRRITSQFLVEDFEKTFSKWAYLPKEKARSFDRAVLCFEDIDGDAFARRLHQKLGLEGERAWSFIDTASQCRWGGIRPLKHWWLPTPSDQSIRGMVIFSTLALEISELKSHVLTTFDEISKEQSW